jgi:hypothetical protein
LVLKHGNFTFNGDHFLQINGAALGRKMAPSYANIYVTSIETRIDPEGSFEDNQWCLSNVRVALIHEVEGGNR